MLGYGLNGRYLWEVPERAKLDAELVRGEYQCSMAGYDAFEKLHVCED